MTPHRKNQSRTVANITGPQQKPAHEQDLRNMQRLTPLKPEIDPFMVAVEYRDQGLCVIPDVLACQRAWLSSFPPQKRLPTYEMMEEWWTDYPEVDVSCVMGPLSDLVAVQVWSFDAHMRLLHRLGGEIPVAPTFFLENCKLHAFTCLFRHPNQPTRSKMKTLQGDITLVGQHGTLVLPPGRHKSGRRFFWESGRSLDDVQPPALPVAIWDMFEERMVRDANHPIY